VPAAHWIDAAAAAAVAAAAVVVAAAPVMCQVIGKLATECEGRAYHSDGCAGEPCAGGMQHRIDQS
jgi:hypothetical protein